MPSMPTSFATKATDERICLFLFPRQDSVIRKMIYFRLSETRRSANSDETGRNFSLTAGAPAMGREAGKQCGPEDSASFCIDRIPLKIKRNFQQKTGRDRPSKERRMGRGKRWESKRRGPLKSSRRAVVYVSSPACRHGLKNRWTFRAVLQKEMTIDHRRRREAFAFRRAALQAVRHSSSVIPTLLTPCVFVTLPPLYRRTATEIREGPRRSSQTPLRGSPIP